MAVTPIFWLTELDLQMAAWFYRPGPNGNWPLADYWLWAAFYELSWVLGLLIIIAAVTLIIGAARGSLDPSWQPRGWTLLLVMVLGVGLVVNVGFKDNFGRYRPRQIETFDGTHAYQVPLQPGIPGTGKSFPSGHPSPAFALGMLYLIWRGRRPLLAWSSLAMALTLGALMGVGRMAAGAHFLSDIIWSGYLMFATSCITYYVIVNVPRREASLAAGEKPGNMTLAKKLSIAALLVVAVLAALLAKPIGFEASYRLDHDQLQSFRIIRLQYDAGELILRDAEAESGMDIHVVSRSFGIPGSGIQAQVEELDGEWLLNLTHQGRFTEKGTRIELTMPAAAKYRLEIKGPDES